VLPAPNGSPNGVVVYPIRAVHMAYIQLSLLHVPAVVVHGNTLSLEEWGYWYTPAHILDGLDGAAPPSCRGRCLRDRGSAGAKPGFLVPKPLGIV
jgi:hypothetical protein